MAKKLTPEQLAEREAAKQQKAAERKAKAEEKKAQAAAKFEVVKEGAGVFGQSVQVIRLKDKSMIVVNWKPTGEKVIPVTEENADEVFKAECENPVISGE